MALECLFIVLGLGDKVMKKRNLKANPFVVALMNNEGVEKIEELQYNKSDQVYNNTVKILTTYFDLEDPLAV